MPTRAAILGARRGQLIAGFVAVALLGLAVTVPPVVVLGVVILALSCVGVFITWWRLDCIPKRPIDIALALTILVLPVAPELNTLAGLGTPLRLGLAALLFALIFAGGGRLARPTRSNGRWLVLAFALYQLVALLGSGNATYGAIRLINWVMFVPIVFVVWDSRLLRTAMAACFSAGVLLALGIALQYLGVLEGTWGGQLLQGIAGAAPVYSLRYTSFMQNPNDLGLAMVSLTVAALLVSGAPGHGPTWRGAFVGAACVMAAGLVLSGSRGALLTLPLLSLYLVAVRRPWVILQLIGVVGLMTVGILTMSVTSPTAVTSPTVPALAPSVAANIGSVVQIAKGEDASATVRLAGWWARISHAGNLLIGAGYGGYGQVQGIDMTQATQRSTLYGSTTVDNGWLKLGLEEGILGVVLLAGIFAYALRRAVWLGRRQDTWALGAIGGSVLVALAFRALTVDILDINPWNFFIWLPVGVLLSDSKHGTESFRLVPAVFSRWRSSRRITLA